MRRVAQGGWSVEPYEGAFLTFKPPFEGLFLTFEAACAGRVERGVSKGIVVRSISDIPGPLRRRIPDIPGALRRGIL